MPKTNQHNVFMLRPPPGARFAFVGSLHPGMLPPGDIEVQFAAGRERETYEWLLSWLHTYVLPAVVRSELPEGHDDPNPEITRLKAMIQADQAASHMTNPGPGMTQSEQKLAAMGIRPVPPTQNHMQYNANPAAQAPQPRRPVGPIVYGPNGPMTPEEVAQLPDRPGPQGYAAPAQYVAPTQAAPVPPSTPNPVAPTEQPPKET